MSSNIASQSPRPSEPQCNFWLIILSDTEIDREGFSGFDTGDKAVPEGTKGIRVTRFTDVWYAYQDNDGDKCKGDLITKLDEVDGEEGCYKVEELGIGCTRLCDGNPGMGADPCAVTTA